MSDPVDKISATEKDVGGKSESSTTRKLQKVVPSVTLASSDSVVSEGIAEGEGKSENHAGENKDEDAGLGVDDGAGGHEDDDQDADEPEIGEEVKVEKMPLNLKVKKKKGPLEYDIGDMYPEISLLTEKKRSEWNYLDPNYIRAIWLEAKTNILADWKMKYTKIKFRKTPSIEVRENLAQSLRKEKLEEKEKVREWWLLYIPPGNDPPVYKTIRLPTNVTMEVRYNYMRNNPPIPSSYITHFEKYKKPPFVPYKPSRCFPQIGV